MKELRREVCSIFPNNSIQLRIYTESSKFFYIFEGAKDFTIQLIFKIDFSC